jgi:uncharacterized protein (TIGR03435 family)
MGPQVVEKTGKKARFFVRTRFGGVANTLSRMLWLCAGPDGDGGLGRGLKAELRFICHSPRLFSGSQEQAGLKLESIRGPIEVLVVDRAEKPTPN